MKYLKVYLLQLLFIPFFISCTKEDSNELLGSGEDVDLEFEDNALIKFTYLEYNVSDEASDCEMKFRIRYADDNYVLNAETDADWITDFDLTSEGTIKFKVKRNDKEEFREAAVDVVYTSGNYKSQGSFKVIQNPKKPLIFGLSETEVGSSWVKFKVDASKDESIKYISSVIPALYLESFNSDTEFFKYEMSIYQSMASEYGLDLKLIIDLLSKTGSQDLQFGLLEPSTEYCVYCYGINDGLELVTSISKMNVITSTVNVSDMTFTVTNKEITSNNAVFDINVSSLDSYVIDCITKADYDILKDNEDNLRKLLSDLDKTYGSNDKYTIKGLKPKTDYVLLLMGIAGNTPTTDINVYEFKTTEVSE